MKSRFSKFLALMLAIVLALGVAPVMVAANEADAGASLPRRPASPAWNREIQVGRWTISDMGAGGAMPVIGQGPNGLLVVGSDLSGLWISDDEGLNFRNAGSYHGFTSLGVFSLAFNPLDGDTFFAGTYGYLYSTFDAGFTFYNNASMLEAGSDGWYHNWVRDDGGQRVPHWTAIAVSLCGDVVYAAYNGSWAGHTERIFVSRDGGRTFNPDDAWLLNADNGATGTMRVQKMIVHPRDPDVLFILSAGDSQVQWGEQNGRSTNGVFRSDFDGTNVTWKSVDGGHATLVPFDSADWSMQFFRDITLDPTDPDIVFISADGNAAGGTEDGNWGAGAADGAERVPGLFAVDSTNNTLVSGIDLEGYGHGPGYVSISTNAAGDNILRMIVRGNAPAVREVTLDAPGRLPDELPEAIEITRINPAFPGIDVGTAISWIKGNVQSMYNPDIHFTTGSQWVNIMDFTGSEPTIEQAFTDRIDERGHDRGTYRGRGLSNVVPHHVAIDHHNPNVIYAAHADIGFEFSTDGGMSWTRSNHRALSSAWGPSTGDPNDSTGLGGGSLFTVPDPNVPGRVWTAYGYETFDKMIIRSDDNGETWNVPANEGLPVWSGEVGQWWSGMGYANSEDFFQNIFRGGRILSIAIDPNSPDIYAPTMFATVSRATWHFPWNSWAFRDADTALTPGYDIYRSGDGAETWTKLDITSAAHDVFMYVAVDPQDGDIVYVGARDGLHRSDDGGATWQRVLHLPTMENYSERYHDHIFGADGHGFDGYPDSGYNYIGVRGIAISPSNPDVVYVAAGLFTSLFRHSDPVASGVYRSTDRGLTFERVYVDPNRTRNLDQFTTSVAVHPTNPDIVFAGSSSVTRSGGHNPLGYIALSTDGGNNWTFINEGLGTPVVGSIAISKLEPNTVWISVQGQSMQKRLFTLHTVTFDANGGDITAENAVTHHDTGRLVSLPTPTRADGYTFAGWFTAPEGGTAVDTSTVFDNDTSIYAQWALVNLIPAQELHAVQVFDDVDVGAWYYDYVNAVVYNNLFQGTAPGIFSPQANMTQAMFVQVLANLEGANLAAYANVPPSFDDVSPGSWYFAAVEWAASLGIAQDAGEGNFAPDAYITVEQIETMLSGLIQIMGIQLPDGEINALIDPQTTTTRAGTAAIFARLLEMIQ